MFLRRGLVESGLICKAYFRPKLYPVEFRMRAISLVRSGKSIADAAQELSISKACLHRCVNQNRAEHGEAPGLTSKEHAELTATRRGIRELDMEIIRRSPEIFRELDLGPKESSW